MTTTYTVTKLEVPKALYDQIAAKLIAAGYDSVKPDFIDMHGLALVPAAASTKPPPDEPFTTAWVRILKAQLVCTCGHEQDGPDNHEGRPVQRCKGCGTVWWTPCAADCEPTDEVPADEEDAAP
jgi:hypothetical protein